MQEARVFKEFVEQGNVILDWYYDEVNTRKLLVSDLIGEVGSAHRIAVVCVDMINDFCDPEKGALGSVRIKRIIPNIVNLMTKLDNVGAEDFILIQDSHSEDSPEFKSYPSHASKDLWGAETISEIRELPCDFTVFFKNSLSPVFSRMWYRAGVEDADAFLDYLNYLDSNDIRVIVVVGNCTDLCVRETAMLVKFWANHYNKNLRVIIPEKCVQTFDLPKEEAEKLGAKPHPGDMMHLLALYEMSRNEIDVVAEIL